MIRRVTVAVVALALVAGAGTSWAVTEHGERVAAQEAAADRVGAAVDAVRAEDDAARDLSGRAVVADVDALLAAARADLEAASAAGRSALDASAGKVADDAVREQLAAALDAADEALAGAPAAARADALTADVTSATAQVTAAQQDWEAQQAAAAKAATRSGSGSGSGSGISCATTYDGPVFYSSVPTADGDGTNGNMPASAMAPLSWTVGSQGGQYWLRADAAAALERLNVAFTAEFGHGLDIDLTYRDYATQKAMREALGSIAARPGYSPHGTGLAIDVPELPCSYGWDTAERSWLVTNGPSYGWVSPSWARENGSSPEYWHYEYTG